MTTVIVIVPDDEEIPVGTVDEEQSVLEAVKESIAEAEADAEVVKEEDS